MESPQELETLRDANNSDSSVKMASPNNPTNNTMTTTPASSAQSQQPQPPPCSASAVEEAAVSPVVDQNPSSASSSAIVVVKEAEAEAKAVSDKSDSSDDEVVAAPPAAAAAVVSVDLSSSTIVAPSAGLPPQTQQPQGSAAPPQEQTNEAAATEATLSASPTAPEAAAAATAASSQALSQPPAPPRQPQQQQPRGARISSRGIPSRAPTRTMGSSLFPKPCLTHSPTLHELQACSFSDYIQNVVLAKALPKFEDDDDDDDQDSVEDEDWCKTAMPLTQGIAKVVLPTGFWAEDGIGRDRTGRGPAWQRGQALGDLMIESPISQHIRGMAGVYEYTFTDNDPISVADFRERADQYRIRQVGQAYDMTTTTTPATKEGDDTKDPQEEPPPREEETPDTSDDRMIQLDRHFWKRLGPTMPAAWYGADQEGTLFGDDLASGWSLGELDSCLHVLSRVPGVTTPYLYAGMWASVFCAHTEDMNLLSINYLHAGAPKIWYAIAPGPDAQRFEALCEFQYATAARECKEFLRHKRYLLSPMVLQKAGIKYTTTIQRPGDAVVTFPGGYHFGFNAGFNMAEATNFGVPQWIPYGLQARVCNCRPDSVRIDMRRLISLLDLFESDRSQRPALSWKEWSRRREQKKKQNKGKHAGGATRQKRSMTGRMTTTTSPTRKTQASGSTQKNNDKKRKLSEQERKNEFWIEVVKPAPTKAASAASKTKVKPKPPVVEEEGGRGKRKRKKTTKAALWEAETKKKEEPVAPAIAAEEVWHLAKPFGRKGVEVNDRVLVLLPGTVMSVAGGADEEDESDDDETDEQCFLGYVVEAADNHARVRLVGLPKSDEVWIPIGVNKLFLDGGRWAQEEDERQGLPKLHYWNEMDSKSRCVAEDDDDE